MNYPELKQTIEQVRHWGFSKRPYHSKHSPYNKLINAAIQGELTLTQFQKIKSLG